MKKGMRCKIVWDRRRIDCSKLVRVSDEGVDFLVLPVKNRKGFNKSASRVYTEHLNIDKNFVMLEVLYSRRQEILNKYQRMVA